MWSEEQMCQDEERDVLTHKIKEKYEILWAESHDFVCKQMVLL